MNLYTNKFEELVDMTEDEKYLEKKYNEVLNSLVRPNGEPVPRHWSIFEVGETYVINNYTFECKYIGETSILFEPIGVVEINNKE